MAGNAVPSVGAQMDGRCGRSDVRKACQEDLSERQQVGAGTALASYPAIKQRL